MGTRTNQGGALRAPTNPNASVIGTETARAERIVVELIAIAVVTLGLLDVLSGGHGRDAEDEPCRQERNG